ncbi:MAG: hypothetical protein IJ813_01290 [Bacteroidales bacterium]|nr:hypothetical protein [Bacteroidales bacterium]
MKKNYESPLTEVISLEHRDPVLDGGSPLVTAAWLTQGGQGNFDYTVEEENVFE